METPSVSARYFLVVDDEPLVRMDLADLVRTCGLEPLEAGTTAEALRILDLQSESIVELITDVNMPGHRNGMVLANHVRVMWPHIRIIVLSAGRLPMSGELPENTLFVAQPWASDELASMISPPA